MHQLGEKICAEYVRKSNSEVTVYSAFLQSTTTVKCHHKIFQTNICVGIYEESILLPQCPVHLARLSCIVSVLFLFVLINVTIKRQPSLCCESWIPNDNLVYAKRTTIEEFATA